MTEYTVPRRHDVALVFEGELLAEVSSQTPGSRRWLETRVYRTESGKYVTEMVGRTVEPGEEDKITVAVHDKPADVRSGFLRTRTSGPMKGQTYLTQQAEDTIDAAAERDPALVASLVERI